MSRVSTGERHGMAIAGHLEVFGPSTKQSVSDDLGMSHKTFDNSIQWYRRHAAPVLEQTIICERDELSGEYQYSLSSEYGDIEVSDGMAGYSARRVKDSISRLVTEFSGKVANCNRYITEHGRNNPGAIGLRSALRSDRQSIEKREEALRTEGNIKAADRLDEFLHMDMVTSL